MKEYKVYAERHSLIDQLPLDTPLGIHICPSTYCNFKCFYCKHTLDVNNESGNKKIGCLSYAFMDLDLFKEIIRQLKQFPRKIKMLNFAWLGEPLMHPQISEMVKIAKDAGVAETISIVTNGSLLTNEMSDKLIEAGVDRLRISLQGLTAQDYWEVSQYKIDYEQYVANIKYFYEHKEHTQLYIKIMDSMLKDEADEKKFREYYENICDDLNIEHLVPLHNELDINDKKDEFNIGYFGNELVENKICSYHFYTMMISPLGRVFPCASADYYMSEDDVMHDLCVCDVNKVSLDTYWNSDACRKFYRRMIEGKRDESVICKRCPYAIYHIAKEDRLDGYEERLMKIYQ